MGKGFNLADTFGEALKNVPNSGTGREQIEYIDEALIAGDERNFYELSGLEELAANIELIGLQQPIRVRPDPDDVGGYLIVSGHRRMAAIRQYLKPEAPDKWAQIPCIIERDNVSAAMQELRLIFANSATREMSNADKAKQAKRVKELLYKLAEEGVEFKGRMRDHVAEAVNATKSQIARWEVIQKGLIPELMNKWESGSLNESQAYALARMESSFQSRLVKATPKLEKYSGWNMEKILEEAKSGKDWIPTLRCPDGGECTHANGFLLHDLSTNWNHCNGKKCCMKCHDGPDCRYSPCDRMCAKAQKAKKERLAGEREAEERERQNRLSAAQLREQRYCARVACAADAAAVPSSTTLQGRYSNKSLELVRRRADGDFSGSNLSYGDIVEPSSVEALISQAKTLQCSTDYLLGLTDDLNPQPTGQMMIMGWMPGGTNPAHPCDCVADFALYDDEDEPTTRMLCYWNGESFRLSNGGLIELRPIRWIELPPKEVPGQ